MEQIFAEGDDEPSSAEPPRKVPRCDTDEYDTQAETLKSPAPRIQPLPISFSPLLESSQEGSPEDEEDSEAITSWAPALRSPKTAGGSQKMPRRMDKGLSVLTRSIYKRLLCSEIGQSAKALAKNEQVPVRRVYDVLHVLESTGTIVAEKIHTMPIYRIMMASPQVEKSIEALDDELIVLDGLIHGLEACLDCLHEQFAEISLLPEDLKAHHACSEVETVNLTIGLGHNGSYLRASFPSEQNKKIDRLVTSKTNELVVWGGEDGNGSISGVPRHLKYLHL